MVTNHTSWWDPLVAVMVTVRLLGADGYALMDASNLERLPFFGRVGAFGVDLRDPADGARAIRHAAKLLGPQGRLVWVFPQGREVPITARPLAFRPGSGEIARVARGAVVVPGALRYEMGAAPRPTLWLSFGPPVEPRHDPREATRAHEAAVETELERVDRAVTRGADREFASVIPPRRERAFELAQSALAWLTRPRLSR